MKLSPQRAAKGLGLILVSGGLIAGVLWVAEVALATNLTSKVTVGASTPSITGVTLNNAATINLTANTTTPVNVNATITDANGCSDILSGTTTILVYRIGVGSSSCLTAPNNLNCYTATAFTATSSCISTSQINTTTTFNIYYFAQATDGSSSFPGSGWKATVNVTSAASATSSADSASTTMSTLTALNVTTSSINFGTLQANTNTGATNQITTSTNAGNSSTTLNLNVGSALTSGSNSIASDTTQTFSTSSFTYQGTSTFITAAGLSVSGYLLTSPTSVTNVAQPLFWGLSVPNGTPTGTYAGTNAFTAVFHN